MWIRSSIVLMLTCTALATAGAQDRSKAPLIRERMRALAPFVGTWRATTTFHERSAGVPEAMEVGTYRISYTLDSTYLDWEIELRGTSGSRRTRLMRVLVTYDPDSSRYASHYFYSRSAIHVFEWGSLDTATHEFRTMAFIPKEDGVHDEHVRTVSTFTSPDEIVYTHYSRKGDATTEWNDFSAVMRRRGNRGWGRRAGVS